MSTTLNTVVRDGGDWAEFFVSERTSTREDGSTRHSATWCCVSSFGVFGHHWYDMGQPFAEFVRGIQPDYLLSKIAKQVFDDAKFIKWLNREIFTARCGPAKKSDAADEFRRLRMDYSGEALATLCYEDEAISHCQPEWCDADSRSHDPQAVAFVQKLWPKFVDAIQAPASSPGVEAPAAQDGNEVTK